MTDANKGIDMPDTKHHAHEYASDAVPPKRDENGFALFYRQDLVEAYLKGAGMEKSYRAPLALVQPSANLYEEAKGFWSNYHWNASLDVTTLVRQAANDGYLAGWVARNKEAIVAAFATRVEELSQPIELTTADGTWKFTATGRHDAKAERIAYIEAPLAPATKDLQEAALAWERSRLGVVGWYDAFLAGAAWKSGREKPSPVPAAAAMTQDEAVNVVVRKLTTIDNRLSDENKFMPVKMGAVVGMLERLQDLVARIETDTKTLLRRSNVEQSKGILRQAVGRRRETPADEIADARRLREIRKAHPITDESGTSCMEVGGVAGEGEV